MRSSGCAVVGIAVYLLTYLLPGSGLAVKAVDLIDREKPMSACFDALRGDPAGFELVCAQF
jgi:hypothetical protein